jgi:MFS family permease
MERRYIVVVGACLTQFTVIGMLFSFGLLFKTFEAEFGWSRMVLSTCSALAFLTMGILAIAAGRLSDRYGPKWVLGISGALFGFGFGLISLVSQPWHLFVIFSVFIGLGMSTHDVVTLSTIARWFEGRRGIMSGVVKVGTAFGQIVLPPLSAFLIVSLGWRPAVALLGVLAFVLLVAAALAMKTPDLKQTPETVQDASGLTFQQARKTGLFWRLCIIQFLFFPTLMTVPVHLAAHGMDLGMTAGRAALLLSVLGSASILGRLVMGGGADRFGGKNAYILSFVLLLASLVGLVATTAHLPLFLIVALYGVTHGGFFTLVSPVVAEYFGMRAHGSIFGTILFCGTLGGSVGPILAGRVFDLTGSYQPSFISLGLLALIGLVLAFYLPYPKTATTGKLGAE